MSDTFTWSPDELYHTGVKGMKWGVRRYQNPDGTLTEAGKKRYARSPEHLGFTPLLGKRGDPVQRQIGYEQIKINKKADKLQKKYDKRLAKKGIKDTKQNKMGLKIEQMLEQSNFRKAMQKTYMNMSKDDQKTIRRGYLNTVDLAASIGSVNSYLNIGISKLIKTTDPENGTVRYLEGKRPYKNLIKN